MRLLFLLSKWFVLYRKAHWHLYLTANLARAWVTICGVQAASPRPPPLVTMAGSSGFLAGSVSHLLYRVGRVVLGSVRVSV